MDHKPETTTTTTTITCKKIIIKISKAYNNYKAYCFII